MRRDDAPTPRTCPACNGGTTDAKRDCKLCRGAGQVDSAKAARWQAWRNTRVTEQFIRIEDQVRDTIAVLERHVHERTWLVTLLNEGKGLLRQYGAASRLPPGSPERTAGVTAYLDFNSRALRALASEKP